MMFNWFLLFVLILFVVAWFYTPPLDKPPPEVWRPLARDKKTTVIIPKQEPKPEPNQEPNTCVIPPEDDAFRR